MEKKQAIEPNNKSKVETNRGKNILKVTVKILPKESVDLLRSITGRGYTLRTSMEETEEASARQQNFPLPLTTTTTTTSTGQSRLHSLAAARCVASTKSVSQGVRKLWWDVGGAVWR